MDPDVTLDELRKALDRAYVADSDSEELYEALDQAVEYFYALDSWLKRGGFLPTEWKR